MATYTGIAGFEHGPPPGGFVSSATAFGIANAGMGTAGGTPEFSSTYAHSGIYSLRINKSTAGNSYLPLNQAVAPFTGAAAGDLVAKVWVYPEAFPGADASAFIYGVTASSVSLQLVCDVDGEIGTKMGADAVQMTGLYLNVDAWNELDILWSDIDTTTWRMDVRVNGTAATQDTSARAGGSTIATLNLGGNGTVSSFDFYYDDVSLSQTPADYPLPEVAFGSLVPTGDGTHYNTTNYFEDAASVVIDGSNVAWDNIDQIPATLATFIQGETNTTDRYIEVTFGTPDGTPLAGRGYVALKAEASSTACTCAAGFSDDSWSTVDWMWGNSTTPADPSQHADYYCWGGKMAVNATTFTSGTLKARFGWTADAAPDVMCGLIMFEYIYEAAGGVDIPHTAGHIDFVGGTHSKTALRAHVAGSLAFAGGEHGKTILHPKEHTAGYLTVSGGTHTLSVRRALVAGALAFAGGTHQKTVSRAHAAGHLDFLGGEHIINIEGPGGINIPHTAGLLTFAGGTHTRSVGRSHTAGYLAFVGGEHTIETSGPINIPHVAGSLVFEGGVHALSKLLAHAGGQLTFAGGTHTLTIQRNKAHTAGVVTVGGGTHALRISRKLTAGVVTILGGEHTVILATDVNIPHVAGYLTITGGTHTLVFTHLSGGWGGPSSRRTGRYARPWIKLPAKRPRHRNRYYGGLPR